MELEAFKKTIADSKAIQRDASAEDKEQRKQEKIAPMTTKFDARGTVSREGATSCVKYSRSSRPSIPMRQCPRCHAIFMLRRCIANSQALDHETVDALEKKLSLPTVVIAGSAYLPALLWPLPLQCTAFQYTVPTPGSLTAPFSRDSASPR
ncbi:hypothetical protein VTO73DRAFT_3255 [Trametes versicolor]